MTMWKTAEGRHQWSARLAGVAQAAISWSVASRTIVGIVLGGPYRIGGRSLNLPWPWRIRLGVVGGNLRLQRVARRILRPGMTVIDVGANVGVTTAMFASLVGPEGRVVAIEAASSTLR